MKWFSKKETSIETPILYPEDEMNIIEAHIAEHFGEFNKVFHEIVSADLHVDIAVIEPTEERDYYTLVTMGMGAHRMNVPPELVEYKLERSELLICLPPDWKLDLGELEIQGGDYDDEITDPNHPGHENWYWPTRWLKTIARLPMDSNTWIGYGHTIPNGENADPFAENTKFGCMILVPPVNFPQEAQVCEMPDGSQVNFYLMLPIHSEEMKFKLANGADDLFEKFSQDPEMDDRLLTLDITRPVVADIQDK